MKAENKFSFDGRAYDNFIKVWATGHVGRPYRGMEKDFAKVAGVSSSSIRRWKRGEPIGRSSLNKILAGFGLGWNHRGLLIKQTVTPVKQHRSSIEKKLSYLVAGMKVLTDGRLIGEESDSND